MNKIIASFLLMAAFAASALDFRSVSFLGADKTQILLTNNQTSGVLFGATNIVYDQAGTLIRKYSNGTNFIVPVLTNGLVQNGVFYGTNGLPVGVTYTNVTQTNLNLLLNPPAWNDVNLWSDSMGNPMNGTISVTIGASQTAAGAGATNTVIFYFNKMPNGVDADGKSTTGLLKFQVQVDWGSTNTVFSTNLYAAAGYALTGPQQLLAGAKSLRLSRIDIANSTTNDIGSVVYIKDISLNGWAP